MVGLDTDSSWDATGVGSLEVCRIAALVMIPEGFHSLAEVVARLP